MAKKMSVEEILAAARAGKAGGSAAPAPKSETKKESPPAKEEALPVAEVVSESPPAAAPAPKAAPPAGKAPAGGKGMDMAAILAAARAGKGAGSAPAPAAKPAPQKEAPAKAAVAEKPAPKPAAAKTDGNGATAAPKDTASILAAARKSAKPGPMTKAEAAALAKPTEPAGKKKLDVPPMPPKPDYARPRPAPAQAADAATRRSFISAAAGMLFGSSLAIGFTSLAATHLMWLLGTARFMFPNILIEPPTRFKVGFPDALAPGQVETKYIAQFGVWVVKYEVEGQPMVYALKSVCTHLGCTPNWLEAEQKFKCPCHGSGFYKDGVNFEGPAPRPLERYAISLADDGQLQVDKSRTFQEEMGQWKDPASFVPV
ncbi:MAG: Rieske (2Fe-2S) protein [Planctomycetaceae bacterium]|nr:Rieske (2Fe-2S) protein [Planctomycetaceae bacterium]